MAAARPAGPRPPGARGRTAARRAPRAGVLLRRPAAARPPRVRAADTVPARVPRGSRSLAARPRQPAGRPPRRARARARLSSPASSARTRVAPQRRRRAVRRARDGACRRRCAAGIEARVHPGLFVVDDLGAIRTWPGRPYTVFTPFHRAWLRGGGAGRTARPRRAPCRRLPPGLDAGRLPELADARAAPGDRGSDAGGRGPGRERMRAFRCQPPLRRYAPTCIRRADGASRLSPYLHFGCLSAARGRGARSRARDRGVSHGSSAGATSTPTCCCTSPATRAPSSRPRYRGTIAWSRADELLRGVARGPDRAIRSSTPACASCGARAGCTTARGWSSARS